MRIFTKIKSNEIKHFVSCLPSVPVYVREFVNEKYNSYLYAISFKDSKGIWVLVCVPDCMQQNFGVGNN